MALSAARSQPVARGVCSRAATTELRLGWLVEPDIEAIARSTMSTPASLAARTEADATPLVSWVWKWIGIPTVSLSARTSFAAAAGRQSPAMSLIARKWAPIRSSSLARPT